MSDSVRFDALRQTVADSLSEPGDLQQTLSRLTQTARDTVPGVDCAGICVRHSSGVLETVAPTRQLLYEADRLQFQLSEGPSYTADADEDVLYSHDLASDARWPTYGPAVAALGLLSQLSIGIAHPLQAHTALNLYSRARDAFTDYRSLGDLFSSQAKIALRYAQEVHSLTVALMSGTTVGRATGVVMERRGLSADAALDFVGDLARIRNVRFVEAAESILAQMATEGRADGS